MILFLLFLCGLCWGSFLNVLATRVLHHRAFFTRRSYCPSCKKIIAWYDNIPLISFLLLHGACRQCRSPISLLYPAIELVAGVLATCLYWHTSQPLPYVAYAIFFSGLVAATRTDLEAMLIPQLFSLGLIPLGFCAASAHLLAISPLESALGACAGYGILWLIATIFLRITKREGMGAGDYDLLAGIGAWTGPLGIWLTLMISSLLGTVVGLAYLYGAKKGPATRIPFGPFLALGAIVYVFFQTSLLSLLGIP
jgi:leader peptidase (prepilin peptidase)/N-methyltransferase